MSSPEPDNLLGEYPPLRKLRYESQFPRLTLIPQSAPTESGAAALAMVLKSKGLEASPTTLHDDLVRISGEISPDAIAAIADQRGLLARVIRVSSTDVEYLPTGTIVELKPSHFVVVESADKRGVSVLDPSSGPTFLSTETFAGRITGAAITLEAAAVTSGAVGAASIRALLLRVLGHKRIVFYIGAVSLIIQLSTLVFPAATGLIFDRVVPLGDHSLLLVLTVVAAVTITTGALASILRTQLLTELRMRIDLTEATSFVSHLSRLPYGYYQNASPGDLLLAIRASHEVRELVLSSVISSLVDTTLVILNVVLLVGTSPIIALVTLSAIAIEALVLVLARPRLIAASLAARDAESRRQTGLNSLLEGVHTLKMLGVERDYLMRWTRTYTEDIRVGLRISRLTAWLESAEGTLAAASPLLVLGVGAYLAVRGQLSIGQLFTAQALAIATMLPFRSLLETVVTAQPKLAAWARCSDILATPVEQPGPGVVLSTLRGSLELQNVSFRYGNLGPWIVRNVSLQVRPREFIAVVGRSGAGKSTLARMLLGLHVPTEGRLAIDGIDIRDMDLGSLRRKVGVVTQKPFFSVDSIRKNIALGSNTATMSQIIQACKMADIHEDIIAMPMGYETILIDRGESLSGGQRQRLAIARALVRRPALLLLDEATSALDTIREKRVQRALDELRCTRIVIAHRLSTIRQASRILVMDRGELVEQGTHDELVARAGTYASLVHAQD